MQPKYSIAQCLALASAAKCRAQQLHADGSLFAANITFYYRIVLRTRINVVEGKGLLYAGCACVSASEQLSIEIATAPVLTCMLTHPS